MRDFIVQAFNESAAVKQQFGRQIEVRTQAALARTTVLAAR